MIPGPIVGVSIASPDLRATEAVYGPHLGYRVVSRASVGAAEAARWGRPALAGRETLVMAPAAGDDFHFRFVASPRRAYRAFAGHGWNAAEIIVADVDALAGRLAGTPFELVGAPQDLSFSDAIRAMQVRGPSGEILYLTQFKRDIPGLPAPPARSDVDRVFIVIAGGPSLDGLLGFYERRFGIARPAAVESRVKAMSAALGLSPEHRYRIAAVPLAGRCYIEADEMPAGASPLVEDPAELPPGIAIVTMEADVDAPICLRGGAGELLELVPRRR